MFERYTESAKRAIFFAHATAHLKGAPAINPDYLLSGSMWEDESRAQTLFHLRELLPSYWENRNRFTIFKLALRPGELPLSDDAKRVLAYAAWEANNMEDYWVGSEHLLLGMLHNPESTAAQNLSKAGITLENARRVVIENKHSRPPDGPVHRLGERPSIMEVAIFRWRTMKFRVRTQARKVKTWVLPN